MTTGEPAEEMPTHPPQQADLQPTTDENAPVPEKRHPHSRLFYIQAGAFVTLFAGVGTETAAIITDQPTPVKAAGWIIFCAGLVGLAGAEIADEKLNPPKPHPHH